MTEEERQTTPTSKRYAFLRRLLQYFSIETELQDNDIIHDEIKKGVIFKGTNLWILFFAIIIGSVGLNMNSTAVIIGAMLISPLMGPINGMGYAIATYNFVLFRKAVKNFTFAVSISLLASTAYFAVSPISTAHSELLARTSPTIYDVLIAMFGGLAGIVAISSRQKGNVIPGVAIATALMPPLCTAGYGLATGQTEFFLGALYLFTINAVFMALSSMVISQLLNFPIRTIVDSAQKQRVNSYISVVILAVLLPSIYFGYGLVKEERFNENAQRFIADVNFFEGNYLLKSEVNRKLREIVLVYGGTSLSESQKEMIREKSKNFQLEKAKIDIRQGLQFSALTEKEQELTTLRLGNAALQDSLRKVHSELNTLQRIPYTGESLLMEIKSIFDAVTICSYALSQQYNAETGKSEEIAIVVFGISKKGLSKSEKSKITSWTENRLKHQRVKVIFD